MKKTKKTHPGVELDEIRQTLRMTNAQWGRPPGRLGESCTNPERLCDIFSPLSSAASPWYWECLF